MLSAKGPEEAPPWCLSSLSLLLTRRTEERRLQKGLFFAKDEPEEAVREDI